MNWSIKACYWQANGGLIKLRPKTQTTSPWKGKKIKNFDQFLDTNFWGKNGDWAEFAGACA